VALTLSQDERRTLESRSRRRVEHAVAHRLGVDRNRRMRAA
jgi:hypothetical protein